MSFFPAFQTGYAWIGLVEPESYSMNDQPTEPFYPSMIAGIRSLAGFGLTSGLFGILFGIAATSAGLSAFQSVFMSVCMFTAAGQFAALEFWQSPLPYATLAISTLLISSRLVLMSVAIVPYVRERPLYVRLAGFTMLMDPNVVLTMNLKKPYDTLGYLFGGGIAMYLGWISGTVIGSVFTNLLSAETMEVLRFAGIIFIGMVMMVVVRGGEKHWWPWIASAIAAVILTKLGIQPALVMILGVAVGVTVVAARMKFKDA